MFLESFNPISQTISCRKYFLAIHYWHHKIFEKTDEKQKYFLFEKNAKNNLCK